MNGIIYLEDGTSFVGKGFGGIGTEVGEIVFNTSMTGYQEILTDPSYSHQIITMTYPIQGNYGVNSNSMQSNNVCAKGMLVKYLNIHPSNCLSEGSLSKFLESNNTIGIHDLDTREITKHIRDTGTLKCIISNDGTSIDELKNILNKTELTCDWMKTEGVNKITCIKGSGYHIGIIDYGIKKSIIDNFVKRNCKITLFPYKTSVAEIINSKIDGLFLSNGPGDPDKAIESIKTIKEFIGKLPIFGICMGHQIIALASGLHTFKMKYGHRGSNHGVINSVNRKSYISAQNHGYAVDHSGIEETDLKILFKNLNDGTIEGLINEKQMLFSAQFHPEGAPGPSDTNFLFDDFLSQIDEVSNAKR